MTDNVKRIDPLSGAIATFSMMYEQALGREVSGRDDVLRDEFDTVIIDTVQAFDTGEWETGISQQSGATGSWTIVAQYPDRDSAAAGHEKWVESLKANPTQALTDIDLWGLRALAEDA